MPSQFNWPLLAETLGTASSLQRRSVCAQPLRIQTARPPRLRQVSHVRQVWKYVILHKITGSDTVKPQKTFNNRLIFGTLPYRPVWQAEAADRPSSNCALDSTIHGTLYLPHKLHEATQKAVSCSLLHPTGVAILHASPPEAQVHTCLPPVWHTYDPCIYIYRMLILASIYLCYGNPSLIKCICKKWRICIPHHKLVPLLKGLVATLSPWRSRFNARASYVGFVVDKVALGLVILQVLEFSPVYHSTSAPQSFMCS